MVKDEYVKKYQSHKGQDINIQLRKQKKMKIHYEQCNGGHLLIESEVSKEHV